MKAGIAIIGGGVVGASIAYHLAERGFRDIVLLEKGGEQGLGSTGKATGGVRSQFGTEINIRMSQYSINFFREFDYDCGYEPRGYLFFATTEKEVSYLKENVCLQKKLGVGDVEMVGSEAIRGIVPGMNCDDILGGSFCASDGFIDPMAVMRGFSEKARDNGAGIELGAEVFSIDAPGGKLKGLVTGRGYLECEKAILCTGAWAKILAKTAGVELPVEPLRRQIVWARSRRLLPEKLPMVIDIGSGFHFRPAKGSREEMLFAFPDRNEESGFKMDFEDSFIPKVAEKARQRASFLAEAEIIREKCRAGLYEITPDQHAVLGECGVEGLYLANGFSGHGVMHSPATGRALAEIILDGEASFMDVSPLCIDRFASGKLLHENAYI